MRGAPQVRFSAIMRKISSRTSLGVGLRPHWLSHFGNELPIELIASAVPPDHRFRGDHHENLFPSGPEPVRQNPEDLIEYRESWPGMPSLQRCELLAKSQVLKKQSARGWGSRFEARSYGTRPEKFRKRFGSCWGTKVPKRRPLPLPKPSRDGTGPGWRLRG